MEKQLIYILMNVLNVFVVKNTCYAIVFININTNAKKK